MKFILFIIINLILSSSFALPTPSDSLDLFVQNKNYRDLLIIKLKDQYGPRDILTRIPLREALFEVKSPVSYRLSPLYRRSASSYQKERQVFLNTQSRHLENYFRYEFKRELSFDEAQGFLKKLYAHPMVEFAYFQPKFVEASYGMKGQVKKKKNFVLSSTPDFENEQFHLKPYPEGVNAYQAWLYRGGDGENIKVIDIENGWHEDHEDFHRPFFKNLLNGSSHHGTAVWGIVAAKENGEGVTGIAPAVEFCVSAVLWEGSFDGYLPNLFNAIDLATQELEAGDVMIIEQQTPGPQNSNYAPVEYWPDIFDVVQMAVKKGIHVVAASGNGHSNLDHKDYKGAFDRQKRDSGAILVAAAGSPKSFHHQRLSFSNYGKRMDLYAYGHDVVTTGYGDLFDQGNERSYSKGFSGTSSATPIVAGAVIALSGLLKNKGIILSPEEMRDVLWESGYAQKDSQLKYIGRFPNLPRAIDRLNF